MAATKRRISRRVQPTVWEALNEPVVEVTEGFAKGIFAVAVILLMMVWIAPYWASAGQSLSVAVYESPIINPEYGRVAGAQITAAPDWIAVAGSLPTDLADSFAQAASQVLDVSEPMSRLNEMYGPGVSAVKDAWLELMADPF